MYHPTTHTYTCSCGQVVTGPIYEYVNVAQDPRLRYIVLSGLLNVISCPLCGRRVTISRPIVYSDPQYNFLAYVHPHADTPEKARRLILKRLRSVYIDITKTQEARISREDAEGDRTVVITPIQAKEMPPLKIVFGFGQLHDLLNAILSPEDRSGKLALSTRSRDTAERAQFFTIARKLALDMDCSVAVQDLPNEYTVWLYGSRRQIGSLMRSLTATV
jgi:CpXC protein